MKDRRNFRYHFSSHLRLTTTFMLMFQATLINCDENGGGFCARLDPDNSVSGCEVVSQVSPSLSSKSGADYQAFKAEFEAAAKSPKLHCPTSLLNDNEDEGQKDNGGLYCRYEEVIEQDMKNLKLEKISKAMLDKARSAVTSAVTYQILGGKLFRSQGCLFPSRCQGIQHFLLKLLAQRPGEIPDLEMVVNTHDWPHIERRYFKEPLPLFSFSKTKDYYDLFYPAWTFWSGGPAISHYPTGIGRWDLMREELEKASRETPWEKKTDLAFFRGSRTSSDRDALILLSRQKPELVDAKYTKNQSWRSKLDTLGEDPVPEVTMEEHCRFKYLFNFRGVAASFRLKHLFMCGSTVIHVGNEWDEFFYQALVPWYHYVPISSADALNMDKLEQVLDFLMANPSISEAIAENGRRFIHDHLKMEDVEQYWRSLLLTYAAKLDFKPQPNPDYISIA